MAASMPSAISRCDLPVAESPIKLSGSPFLTHSQVARGMWMTAASIVGVRQNMLNPRTGERAQLMMR